MFEGKKKKIINAKLKDSIKKIIEGESICYHKLNDNHNERAIKSHSIWNFGILKLLAEDNKIFWLDPKKRYKVFDEDENLFHEVLTEKATIFRGFCSDHDDKIFEPIEKNNAYKESEIQKFLYSYRAFSFQHVQSKLSKIAYEKFYREILGLYENKIFRKNEVGYIQNILIMHRIRDKRGDKIFEETKKKFHSTFALQGLDNKGFEESIDENFIMRSYRLNGKIEFACSGIGDPLINTKGVRIMTKDSGFIFLNIFPQNEKESYFILGLLKKDLKVYSDIIEFFDKEYKNYLKDEKDLFLLAVQNLMINSSENIVLSKKLYSSLDSSGELEHVVNQFNGSISSNVEEQKYYQNLKQDHGFTLFI
ncbi:hypothetical protein IGW_05300 [Bacillus cereus ISP3191]|uniref:hypothetical protein n=1 Tax=Bacillus cereus group TaxID=86661 RepID=UPI0002795210|nr:hypothetical protein [Bacillus cereus]EJQ86908.1 hypothetical protein IGW_05300 [Bacillus cereus ISP3191]MDR4319717.1 hypothetical protein [Bacillus paranthracis]